MLCFLFVQLERGESLVELVRAKKSLSVNNCPLVLMAPAVSAFAANFDLGVDKFDGCGIPVIIGYPVSGKSTALKEETNLTLSSEFLAIPKTICQKSLETPKTRHM